MQLMHWDTFEQYNYKLSTVGGDWGCKVGDIRPPGTSSPMLDQKGFKLQ